MIVYCDQGQLTWINNGYAIQVQTQREPNINV